MKGSVHHDKKSKRWFVSIYWEGKRYKFFKHPITGEPFWAKQSAEKQLNRIRTEVDEGYFNPKHWKVGNPLLVTNYLISWLNAIDVSPNTLRGYKSAVNNYIIPFFGEKDIRHIRYNDLIKFHAWIPLHDKGKYNVVSTLKTILRYAYKSEEIPRVPPFPALSYQEPEIEYLELEQQEEILTHIPKNDRPIFQFMMEYGCRPGEARALQKDCIKSDEIIIKRAFSDNKLRETTKTKKIRREPITDYMSNILKNIPLNISPFVFVRHDFKPYTTNNLNQIWRNACNKAGIKIKLYNGVRHSLGCQMLNMGLPLDMVQDQLGHSCPDMARRYAKRSINLRKDALELKRKNVVEFNRKVSKQSANNT